MVTPRLPSQARWEDRGQLAPGPNRRRPLRFHAVGDGAGSRESGAAHGGASPVDAAPWGSLTGSSAPAVPGPQGRSLRRESECRHVPERTAAWGATRVCRASGAAGEAAPRPYTGRAVLSGAAQSGHGWAVQPRPVGVRRCLTRRPRGPVIVAGERVPPCARAHRSVGRHAGVPRLWRGGRGSASPLQGVGGASPVQRVSPAVAYPRPRPVGVRRCLTRRWCAEGSESAGGRNGLVAARGLG